jgi:Tfp pilus assembly protein FimT
MKKLMLMVCLIAGMSMTASAQISKKSPEQRAAHHTKALQKKLNLTAAQATQVNAAFLTQATRMDSLKHNQSADKKENKLTAKSIRLSTKKQVVAVLSDEQKTKFAAFEKQKKEKHKERKAPKDVVEG